MWSFLLAARQKIRTNLVEKGDERHFHLSANYLEKKKQLSYARLHSRPKNYRINKQVVFFIRDRAENINNKTQLVEKEDENLDIYFMNLAN